ncbi:MAG: 16S rRNA (cytosine(1402)-N(4))-methyltransferase RsmH [Candidatus Roizmanbacteria bacterium]
MPVHTPVYLDQVLETLNIQKGQYFIDATAGEGGHIAGIIKQGGVVLGIDWDPSQIEKLNIKFQENKNVKLVCGNYADIATIATKEGFDQVDGVLVDLGLSMAQIFFAGRGFSFKKLDEPLDMRIGKIESQTASDILNSYSYQELSDLFSSYGEELLSDDVAREVVSYRERKIFSTVEDLVKTLHTVIKTKTQTHEVQFEKMASRIFQALRIAVNKEFENIKLCLEESLKIIKKGGKLIFISFHSREDRIIKQFVRLHQLKIIKPDLNRSDKRSFERSAMLRIVQL